MRIGINGRFLVAKRTGVQRAAYNLIKTLFEIDRENEYILFTGEEQAKEWNYPNVKLVTSRLKVGENLRNHLWEQFVLPRLARKHEVDILHSPANMAPLFYRGASIVHIHDLCFVVNPQWYSYLFHTAYNVAIPRLAKRASRVITNSNNSRNDLLQFYQVDASKVRLIYWAVDQTFGSEPVADRRIEEEGDYILYVGSLEPRKNIATLIEAYEQLRTDNPDLKTKLILIGGESPLFAAVRLQIKQFHNDVVFKGFVSDDELKQYYRNALVVAYPSLYEGFGLPPLEAMASGAPVVTSNTSSLPEVVGDAALMVSPYDCAQLAGTLARVIRDRRLREEMRRRGFEQVKKFNWYRVARNVLAVYYEVYCETGQGRGDACMPFEKWQQMIKREERYIKQSSELPIERPRLRSQGPIMNPPVLHPRGTAQL
ncbi:MAG TPA: glycosyltransferase family 1 protein [Oligoflexus sp.]|uniref:glycosyltransferase family 4 protein n=1 Tax=Oligoflexus sp. TaxID=1971216 RepID=UPI002D7F80FA|nr:glycosyltransferase family 1 protein [Oligoflexus sp.]HET9236260.1 glycosyltransferase family 1 protein [Oligoflexus sp.]